MAYGAAQYADITADLARRGLPAEFTQTGGMCAAIVVTLESGFYLLITDREDTLPWERDEHEGWYVGLYADGDGGQPPLRYEETDESSALALLRVVDAVLRV